MLQSKEQIGRFDREITFIQSIEVDGISNEDKKIGWEEIENYPTVSAKKRNLKGNEVPIADRLNAIYPVVFTIRYRDDLNEKMRVVCDGKVYEITAPIEEPEDGRRRFLNVYANYLDNEPNPIT